MSRRGSLNGGFRTCNCFNPNQGAIQFAGFTAAVNNSAESALDVMRKQLVLGLGLLFSMYSACASAQVPSVGDPSSSSNTPDCSDPSSANSPDCSASQYQSGQGSTSGYGRTNPGATT